VTLTSGNKRFAITGDAVAPARFGLEDIMVGMARQQAMARRATSEKQPALSA
jgi:hypothetical protein